MNFVIIVLGILFLTGLPVGKALAICAIIEGILVTINAIVDKYKNSKGV
jgi:hypothetical protein